MIARRYCYLCGRVLRVCGLVIAGGPVVYIIRCPRCDTVRDAR